MRVYFALLKLVMKRRRISIVSIVFGLKWIFRIFYKKIKFCKKSSLAVSELHTEPEIVYNFTTVGPMFIIIDSLD